MVDIAQSSLEIPPSQEFLFPTIDFIDAYASQLGVEPARRERLRTATEAALATVMGSSVGGLNDERIAVDIFESEGNLMVEVINRGVPILFSGPEGGSSAKLREAAKGIDRLSIENMGRQGQTVVLGIRLGEHAAGKAIAASDKNQDLANYTEADIVIREMRPEEVGALSQLFYHVYSYNYINEFVYYPEKVAQMISDGKLISVVAALPNGTLVGHVGLLRWNEAPAVYEPCLGVTDPRLKSRGLFKLLFQKTMECVHRLPMNYAFFDFVTNHDYTQRFVSTYGMADLALFVGCQSKETQAKLERLGLGADPKEMDRYSLLFSVIPRTPNPFGKLVQLPNNLGELLGFLLTPLNISWIPSSRFQVLPSEGHSETRLQTAQNAVIFDLFKPGRKALERVVKDWAQFLRNGYQYGAVEIPLDEPGLAQVCDYLCQHGFFVSGFVPYHYSDRLALRMQSIGPTKVAFDEIKVYTESAKRLLKIVRDSYERNQLL